MEAASTIRIFRKAKETPNASASMLVAKAIHTSVFVRQGTLCPPQAQPVFSGRKLSQTIFPPRKANSANAIQ